jgi:hypothetical protein
MSTVRNMPGRPVSATETKRPPREKAASATWGRWTRVLVSVLLVWHIFAVFLGPFSIPPSSRLVEQVAFSPVMSWYIRPLYLHHGYGFFAPDPGATFLVRYHVTTKDGKEITGVFPDPDKQWPRLRNHRYMMLADQAKLPIFGESMDQRAQAMLRTYARQLLREHDGVQARVEHVSHRMLTPEEKLAGVKLDDPRTYQVILTEVQSARDLETPQQYPHELASDPAWQAGEQPTARSGA